MGGISRSVPGRVCAFLLSFVLVAGPVFQAVPAFASSGEDAPVQPSQATAPAEPAPAPEPATVVRELEGERTEVATSYLLSDGNVKTVVSEAPVRFEDADGQWQEIDTTLVPGDRPKEVVSASTSVTVGFASQTPGTPPVTLEGQDFSIGVNMLGVVEDTKLVSGNTVRYLADAARGVTLEYQALDSGIKETVVLANADAPSSFEFTVALDGVELRQVPGGTFGFYRPGDDEMLLELGSLSVSDSFGGMYSPDHAVCTETTMTVESVDAHTVKVRYEVSPEWLADPARVYPVRVDPTIASPVTDTWIHEGSPTYNGWSADGWMNVGASSGKQLWSLVKFDLTQQQIPSDAAVVSAGLNLYQFSVTGTNPSITRCTANTAFSNSTSWNTRPAITTWSTVSYSNTAAQWLNLDVANIVRHWLDEDPVNHGFVLKGASAGTNYRQFRTKDYATTSQRPTLEVVWTPQPVTNLTATTVASEGWFREVDRDDDGHADTPNDKADLGRGSVDLSWSPADVADGYRIYLKDGQDWVKVGQTVGNGATQWSSEGVGIFPTDSDYTGLADDSWAANPFASAQSPSLSTLEDSIAVSGGGPGVVVTDGSFLYHRAWGEYPGETQWTRLGTGLNSTSATETVGIGPGFAGKQIRSAFYLDGFIYNGHAITPGSIEGVPVSASSGDDSAVKTLEFTFSGGSAAPLLNRNTGWQLSDTDDAGEVLLAASDESIYSVAYDIPGDGLAESGFRIREFSRDGLYSGYHDIPMESYYTDGVIADGDNLYLMEWSGSSRVTKVSTKTWRVVDQWQAGWGARREISGCYDAANNVFWLGSLDQGTIGRYKGRGLDLRDDPKALYSKTNGEALDDQSYYQFRVAAYSDNQSATENPVDIAATLENRTVRVNDDPRHTSHDLGSIADHSATVTLDRGALELDVTDLEIASWGPSASLSRHYDSASSYTGAFAPGWRFNYEQTLVVSGDLATHTDATGEEHRFTRNTTTNAWEAPNGDYSALAADGSGWMITGKDRSVTRFDSSGRLISESDANGNTVTYAWNPGRTQLTITAANGQQIIAEFTAAGAIKHATHTVNDTSIPAPNRERRIEFNDGAGYSGALVNTVVRFANDSVTAEPGYDASTSPFNKTTRYTANAIGRLTKLEVPEFTTESPYGAKWEFEYLTGGQFERVKWPGYEQDSGRATALIYDNPARKATVRTTAQVDGQPQAIEQLYQWNPTGTQAWYSNKKKEIDTSLEKWEYTYSPQNEVTSEKSPEAVTTRTVYDSRGNAVFEFDGKGGITRNVYNASDDLIRTVSPAGRTTYFTYDAKGNTTAEEKVLTAQGERSRTEYVYDSRGLLDSERSRISVSPETWAETDYASFADNGEPQSTTHLGVKLSSGSSTVPLTTTKAYDDHGNLLWEKDATGRWVAKDNVYDIAGRLITSTDASGTATHRVFDKLGFEQETWRQNGASRADHTLAEYSADGWLLKRTHLVSRPGGEQNDRVTTHTYDASGNEVTNVAPAGATTTAYDAESQPVQQETPGTETPATASYDSDGNVTESTEPGNSEPDQTSYDANGEVTAEDPAGPLDADANPDNDDADATEYEYDEDGNETEVSVPTDTGTKVVEAASFYDVGGRLTKSTDAKGFVTTFTYDQLDRQLAATSDGKSATKVYNTLGWVLTETDLDGTVKAFTYDEAGRVTDESLAGKVTSTVYDAMGRAGLVTKPDGSTAGYLYDEFGRTTGETHRRPDATFARQISRTYDSLGREETSTDAVSGISTATTWNADAQASHARSFGETTVTVTFDQPGREQAVSVESSGTTVSRSVTDRDDAGRTTAWALDAGTGLTQGVQYDSVDGKLKKQTGAGLGSGGISYTYNAYTSRQDGEAIDLSYPDADRTSNYTYDQAGRLTEVMVDGAVSVVSSYTADGRINLNGARSFTYRTEAQRTQQLLSMTEGGVATSFSYDSRGRRTGYTSPAESVAYHYNDDDRLIAFERDTGKDGIIDTSATYAYDSDGQRTRSVVTRGGVTTTTSWLYEGLTLLRAQSVSEGATTTVEYATDSAGRPFGAWVTIPERDGAVWVWLVTNQRGDVLELLAADGTPISHRAYSAYGETIGGASRAGGGLTGGEATAIDSAITLRYAGYTHDGESGLYYCSQRYYDPITCQWITKDPARADGEESAYQYCGGDPVGSVDSLGLFRFRVYASGSKSNPIGGHAWISIKNRSKEPIKFLGLKIKKNQTLHIGAREKQVSNGVWFNAEPYAADRKNPFRKYKRRVSLMGDYSDKKLKPLEDYVRSFGTYCAPWKNCSTLAEKAWNTVSLRKVSAWQGVVYTPNALHASIKKFKNHGSVGFGNWSKKNVGYLDSSGKFVKTNPVFD